MKKKILTALILNLVSVTAFANPRPMVRFYNVVGDAMFVCKDDHGRVRLHLGMASSQGYELTGDLVSEGLDTIQNSEIHGNAFYLDVSGPDLDEGEARLIFNLNTLKEEGKVHATTLISADAAGDDAWKGAHREQLDCDLE